MQSTWFQLLQGVINHNFRTTESILVFCNTFTCHCSLKPTIHFTGLPSRRLLNLASHTRRACFVNQTLVIEDVALDNHFKKPVMPLSRHKVQLQTYDKPQLDSSWSQNKYAEEVTMLCYMLLENAMHEFVSAEAYVSLCGGPSSSNTTQTLEM